jgi:hypothetical protein
VVSGAGKPAPSAVDQLRLRTDAPLSAERDWYQIGANRTLGSGIRDGQAAHADHPVMAQYRQIPDGPGYRALGGSRSLPESRVVTLRFRLAVSSAYAFMARGSKRPDKRPRQ